MLHVFLPKSISKDAITVKYPVTERGNIYANTHLETCHYIPDII